MEIFGYVVQNAPGYPGSLGKLPKIEIMGFVVQIAPGYLGKTNYKFLKTDWLHPVQAVPLKLDCSAFTRYNLKLLRVCRNSYVFICPFALLTIPT